MERGIPSTHCRWGSLPGGQPGAERVPGGTAALPAWHSSRLGAGSTCRRKEESLGWPGMWHRLLLRHPAQALRALRPPAPHHPEASLSCPFPRQAAASPCKPCPIPVSAPSLCPDAVPRASGWHHPAGSGMELGVNPASLSVLPKKLIPSCCCQEPGLHIAKLRRVLLGLCRAPKLPWGQR